MSQTEEQLVKASRQGDANAFGQLAQIYQSRVFALALRMIGDRLTAEDLTQEAFLRAYQKLDTYRGEARFYTWLYRIAINLCLRHLQRERRLTFADWPPIPVEDDEVIPDDALSPEDLVLREEVKVGCLTGLVRCLSRQQRATFVLAVLLDPPNRDVAAILGCSLGAVKARLHRARRTLTSFLERRCQWIDGSNQCQCHKWIEQAIEAETGQRRTRCQLGGVDVLPQGGSHCRPQSMGGRG